MKLNVEELETATFALAQALGIMHRQAAEVRRNGGRESLLRSLQGEIERTDNLLRRFQDERFKGGSHD